jgi:TolB-like protein
MRKNPLLPLASVSTLLFLITPSAWAGDYDKLASQMSRSAKAHGRQRLAVLPFHAVSGGDSKTGQIVSERLVAPLMADGTIEIIERTLLESVTRELRLQVSGLMDPTTVRELGKILNVDALVLGTVMTLKDDRVEINARLIDTQTAKILGAASVKVEKDWSESMFEDFSWGLSLPPMPSFELIPNAHAGGFDCERAEETIDELERSLIDLKARYWAKRLHAGLAAGSLKKNPGTEIRNTQIRSQFYARLHERYAESGPGLTSSEIAKMKDGIARIENLNESCSEGGL